MNNVTNRQISVMLYSIIIGYGVINIPKDVGEAAGTGSWISLLLGTIIFMGITYMITYLQYVHEGKTLYEYSKILVGKFVTAIFLFIYCTYFFVFLSMLTRLYSEVIKLIILMKTPEIFICLLVYIVVGYALSKGINVIARLCEIYVPINILGTIFITFLLATKGKLVNIRPLFSTEDIIIYFKALKTTILPFLGMEILAFIPITRVQNKNIFKYTILTVAGIGILFTVIVEAGISVVGVESIIYLKATMLSVLKGVDIYSLDIIRRLDGIYIIIWSMNLVCAMSLWAYGVVIILNRKFKSIKYNHMVIIVICLSFILSQMPRTMDQVQKIMKYNAYLGIVAVFVIPMILFIVTKVKKYDREI